MAGRTASAERKTKETTIYVSVDLDGTGKNSVDTGVGFLNHMLDLLGKHAMIDLVVKAGGDTEVDDHHTTEDIGIVLGQAVAKALGDKVGINRFGFASVPMDEARAEVTVDISGRPYFIFDGEISADKVGGFDTELVPEFLQGVATNLGANLHVSVRAAGNAHHTIEAIFKATARALRRAVEIDIRQEGVPSTKGVL